jgi:hypothetical protein
MGNDTIGGQVPGGQGAFVARLEAVERRVRELASVRSLGTSSVGAGGLTVNPEGTSLQIRVDENVVLPEDPANTYTGATLAFDLDGGGGEATIRLLDDSSYPFLQIRSLPTASDEITVVNLSAAGWSFETFNGDGTSSSLQCGYSGGASFNFPTGFVNLLSGTIVTALDSGPRASLGYDQIRADNLLFVNSGNTEWRAQSNSTFGYVPIRASSFPTSSARGAKQDVHEIPFDPLAAIRAAPAMRWQYKTGDHRHHISAMADDLPPEIVDDDGQGDLSVDTRDLIGVLWAAVSALADSNDALLARVADLETLQAETS